MKKWRASRKIFSESHSPFFKGSTRSGRDLFSLFQREYSARMEGFILPFSKGVREAGGIYSPFFKGSTPQGGRDLFFK